MRSCLSVPHVLYCSHTGVILFHQITYCDFSLQKRAQTRLHTISDSRMNENVLNLSCARENQMLCVFLVLRITRCTSLGLVFICVSIWSAEGCVKEDWKMKKFKRVTDASLSLSPSLLIESK